MKKHQSGFALIELVVILVILVGVIGVGYYIYSHRSGAVTGQTAATSSSSTPTSTAPTTFAAPQVNSPAQLSSALTALNNADISGNSTDSSQLTTQTSGF